MMSGSGEVGCGCRELLNSWPRRRLIEGCEAVAGVGASWEDGLRWSGRLFIVIEVLMRAWLRLLELLLVVVDMSERLGKY